MLMLLIGIYRQLCRIENGLKSAQLRLLAGLINHVSNRFKPSYPIFCGILRKYLIMKLRPEWQLYYDFAGFGYENGCIGTHSLGPDDLPGAIGGTENETEHHWRHNIAGEILLSI